MAGATRVLLLWIYITGIVEGIKSKGSSWWKPSFRTSIFKKFADKNIDEKLAPVPIFVLKGSNSVPYIRHSRDLEADVVPMYVDYDDAEDFLKDICRASSNEDRPHIEVLSMSKCYELSKTGEFGQKFVFFPSSKTKQWLKQGRKLCKPYNKIKTPGPSHYYKGDTILDTMKYLINSQMGKTACLIGYEAVGMKVKRNGQDDIKPLFLSFDDLMTQWNERRKSNPSMPVKPKLSVVNLLEVAVAMENVNQLPSSTKRKFQNIGFVPSTESVKKVDEIRAQGTGKARKHIA